MDKQDHDALATIKNKHKSHYHNNADSDREIPSHNILPDPEDPFLNPINLKEYL